MARCENAFSERFTSPLSVGSWTELSVRKSRRSHIRAHHRSRGRERKTERAREIVLIIVDKTGGDRGTLEWHSGAENAVHVLQIYIARDGRVMEVGSMAVLRLTEVPTSIPPAAPRQYHNRTHRIPQETAEPRYRPRSTQTC